MAIDITPHSLSVNKLIRSYGNSGFRIGDQFYNGSVFMLNESIVPWAATGANSCFVESLEAHVKNATDFDILIVGSGLRSTPPNIKLRSMLKSHKIVLEWMNTGAACRTYNVLVLENRPVAAALIAIE